MRPGSHVIQLKQHSHADEDTTGTQWSEANFAVCLSDLDNTTQVLLKTQTSLKQPTKKQNQGTNTIFVKHGLWSINDYFLD